MTSVHDADGTGCGHNCTEYNNCYQYQQPVTWSEATNYLESDLNNVYSSLLNWGGVCNLNTNQFSALVDYAYIHGTSYAFNQFGQYVANNQTAKACAKMSKSKVLRDQADGFLCSTPTSENAGVLR